MFKKLRNKFLFINVIAIISVLISSFFAVFIITFNNVKSDVKKELSKIIVGRGPITSAIPNEFNAPIIMFDRNDFFKSRTLTFWIELDINKNIIIVNRPTIWNNNEDFDTIAIHLLTKALDKNTNLSYFKYENNYYAFELLNHGNGYRIAFIDITDNVKVLLNFIYSFLFVSLASAIVIVVFSKYAADNAIKPINETYDKQKRFISDASHELKTPLTIINANIDLVLNKKNESIIKQEKNLNYIKTEGIKMAKLINDLLYLSKTEQDNETVFTKQNLSELIQDSILPMEAVIYEKQLKFKYNIEPYIYIKGHAEQIKQVILIIIDNAVKYCNEKGEINVTLTKQNKEAILIIENTGIGIDKENINHIFERFYRVDESRSKETGGFGLGLSIAKNIINKHKGKIKITSIKNKRTTVTISFSCPDEY